MEQGKGLHDKRVAILGGSSGIGLAVAEQAASQGAKLVIASSNAERVRKAIEKLEGNAQGHTLDLTDESAVENSFAKLGRSITWYSLLATACICTTSPPRI